MLRTLLCVGVILILASPAAGSLFVYDCPSIEPCPASNGAGTIVSSEQRYNTETQLYEWVVSFVPQNGKTPDALWMVVSDGPEPEFTDQVAILYADRATGRVSAYVYDSTRNEDSWEVPAGFIESIPNGVMVTVHPDERVTFSLTIDATFINAFQSPPMWRGLQFGDTIGFWGAGLADAAIVFDTEGRIESFSFGPRSSYDRTERSTVEELVAVQTTTWGDVKIRYRD